MSDDDSDTDCEIEGISISTRVFPKKNDNYTKSGKAQTSQTSKNADVSDKINQETTKNVLNESEKNSKKNSQDLNNDEAPKLVKIQPNKSLSSDSETDCEEDLNKVYNNKSENTNATPKTSGGHSDDEQNVEDKLNDTDYIPGTQDAFAEAFSYRSDPGKSSSTEDFRLGLTQLMEDSLNGETSKNSHTKIESLEKKEEDVIGIENEATSTTAENNKNGQVSEKLMAN